VVNWHRFTASDFEYDFENNKLAAHQVTFDEAVNVSSQTSESERTSASKTVIS